MQHDLWVEKYRPDTLDGYVFKDVSMEETIRGWIANTEGKRIPIPHLLLSGVQGTGKTTLAKILINVLGVESGDVLEINASRENGVDTIRSKIVNFCSTWAIGDYKIILLDEVDKMSFDAQAILRGETERFSDSVRFIMTCNYPNKIIPALHSRFQSFHITRLDEENFMHRMIEVLLAENVDFEPEHLQDFVNHSYPDLRKCINLLDQNTKGGKLSPLRREEETSLNFMDTFIELFMAKRYMEARKYICGVATTDDFIGIYTYFYNNLSKFTSDSDIEDRIIIEIKQGLRDHALVADPEINLASVVIKISELCK